MFPIWLTCIVAVLACAVDSKSIDVQNSIFSDRIYKGQDAKIEDFAYQVSIQMHGKHICGGSIINRRVILTAAHCIRENLTHHITIRAGSSNVSRGGVIRQVKKQIKHENYFYVESDIGLLILADYLEFSDTIQPIKLPNGNHELIEGDLAILTGWGFTELFIQPENLQKTEIPILNHESCQKKFIAEITPRVLCAGFNQPDTSNACSGDSGGPLVQNGVVYGIVSFGTYYCYNQITIYTRVSAFLKWIDDKINIE